MKKLDWYILKKFLSTFFFAIFLFTVIAVVIDISEKADDLVKSQLGVVGIITQYYFAFIPQIIGILFPLFVFIAVIFFTSKMAGRSEVIAILASGTRFNRWLRPYVVGGVFLASLLWYANNFLIPRTNKMVGAFSAKYFDANSSYEAISRQNGANNLYMKIDSFTYAGIANYDTGTKRGGPFFMYRVTGNQLQENLRADNIYWDVSMKKWKLDGIIRRDIAGLKEKLTPETTRDMDFGFSPADLNRNKYTKDVLTTPELKRYVHREEMSGSEGLNELNVELGRRNATPVTVLLLTLIGAVIAGRKVRGGSGLHLALGFVIAALFIITDKFSTVFSTKGNFPPQLAAWTPNIIFLVVAFFLYRSAPK